MRVLLVQPPDEMEDMLGAGKELVQKYEPLGLLYVAASVREAGHEVSVIDAHGESLDAEELKRRIAAHAPDVVGFSVLTCSGAIVYELGRWLKRELPLATVVLGNLHASVFAQQYLEHGCCDFVVHGEGEVPFTRIVEHLAGRCGLGDVPAVSFKAEDGRIARAHPRAYLVSDLSRLPRPARDLVDRSLYSLDALSNQVYAGEGMDKTMTMGTSRGCCYKCTFCSVNLEPRFADPKSAVDEMESLEKEYGARYLMLTDSLLMHDKDRLLRICDEIRRRKLKVLWGCDARVNYITPEVVRAMDSANCYDYSFGIESGVQRLLNAVKKGQTIEQVERAVAAVREHSDIQVAGLFVLGLPGETYEDSLETIRFAKRLPLDMAQFSLCTPYPGSRLFEDLRAKGELDTGVRPGGALDTSVWKRYSGYISFTDNDPIWVTPGLDAERLKGLQKRAQREFYLRPAQILRHMKRLRPANIPRVLKIVWRGFF